MNDKVKLTQQGYDELSKEYRDLIDNQEPAAKAQLKAARELGDLSENADYHAAKETLGRIKDRIAEIEAILHNYEIIVVKKSDKVQLGSTVEIEYLDLGIKKEIRIVGIEESDAINNRISSQSPLGSALLNAKKDDVVEVKAKQNHSVKVVSIK